MTTPHLAAAPTGAPMPLDISPSERRARGLVREPVVDPLATPLQLRYPTSVPAVRVAVSGAPVLLVYLDDTRGAPVRPLGDPIVLPEGEAVVALKPSRRLRLAALGAHLTLTVTLRAVLPPPAPPPVVTLEEMRRALAAVHG